jgi:cell division protein FtsB
MARMPFDPPEGAVATPPGRRRPRTAQESRDLRRKRITFGLSIALFVLLVNSIVGENGYLAALRVREEKAELEAAVAALRRDNQRLKSERERLLSDPSALEEAARRSLGMIRPGETLMILRPADAVEPAPAR